MSASAVVVLAAVLLATVVGRAGHARAGRRLRRVLGRGGAVRRGRVPGAAVVVRAEPPVGPTDLAAVVGELAGLVRAGVPLAAAWAHVAGSAGSDAAGDALRGAALAASSGEEVGAGLRARSGGAGPDSLGLAALAGSVTVLERTGAPAGDVLDRLADSLRDAADLRSARRTAMAAPVATARVLAVLPVLGLGLGQLVGASPVAVLVGTPVGRVSAVVGLVFVVAGVVWTRALVRAAAGR